MILPRRIKAPTTPAQNFRITDDGGKLRATCATWDDAFRGPSRQEGGMTREKAVDLVMNAQRGVCRRAGVLLLPDAGIQGAKTARPNGRGRRQAPRGVPSVAAVVVSVVAVAADCVTPARRPRHRQCPQ